MSERIDWKRRLDPYAERWVEFVIATETALRDESESDLRSLRAAVEQPTLTNCSWGTYGVALYLRDAIEVEVYRRRHAGVSDG